MKRFAILVLCLAGFACAGAADYVYPYFDFSAGATYLKTFYQKDSRYNFYYDREKDVIVRDNDLHYDVMSFAAWGFDADFKAGASIFRKFLPVTLIPFVDLGWFRVSGTKKYKYYSMDKDYRYRDETRYYTSFLLGIMVYPIKSETSLFHGVFVSAAVGPSVKQYDHDANGVDYSDQETILKFELGNVWDVTEHYAVGFEGKAVLGFSFNDDESRDDVTVNSKSFGIALKVVRK